MAARDVAQARGLLELIDRQALHARELSFVHPVLESELSLTAALPQDMQTLLARLRSRLPSEAARGKRR
jgi:23S rRNA pseudouridine1911/1915/1917 synthase